MNFFALLKANADVVKAELKHLDLHIANEGITNLRATAPFVYVRLHGPDPHHLYAGSYSDDDLRWWADRIREWEAQGRDAFAYFNNDYDGHAVVDAEWLRSRLDPDWSPTALSSG